MPSPSTGSPRNEATGAWLRHDVLGFCVGLLFPAAAIGLAALLRRPLLSHPATWVLCAVPPALAAAGVVLRRTRHALAAELRARARRAEEDLAARERMAQDLAAASSALQERVASIMAACSQTSGTVHQTFEMVAQLSGTATQAALQAETVIGIARRSERASESAGAVAETTGTELLALAGDVKEMAERIDLLHQRLVALGDVTSALRWMSSRSHDLATACAVAACTAEVERFHVIAEDLRAHANDSKFVAQEAEAIVTEVTAAMDAARVAAQTGSRRAASDAEIVQQTGERIRGLGVALRESAAAAAHIAQVAQVQGGAFDQVMSAMNEICLATESNVDATGAVAEKAHALETLAASLRSAAGAPDAVAPAEPVFARAGVRAEA